VFRKKRPIDVVGPGLDERARDLVTKIPGGTPIQIPAHYPEFASYYPECELQTKKWFIDNVRQEWICVDAGANIGYHSILMARLAQSGTVYAFEPTETHDFLVSNIEANNASNVTPLRLGLSDRSFRGEESIFRIWGHDPEVTEVEFVTLDEFAVRVGLERLDLIKIDVDGFDLEVLWGAESVLKRFQPVVIVELHTISGNLVACRPGISVGARLGLGQLGFLTAWGQFGSPNIYRFDRSLVTSPRRTQRGRRSARHSRRTVTQRSSCG
jgi:FkbM family methyltransferase